MRRTALGLICVVLTGLAVWQASPATAERVTIPDTRQPGLPVNMDLLKVRINNAEDTVVLKVRFADLVDTTRARTQVLVDPRPNDDVQYIAEWEFHPGRAAETRLLIATDQEFGGEPIPCDTLVGVENFDTDVVRIKVPQSCLKRNGRIAAFKAVSGFWRRTGDYTDYVTARRG